MNFTLFLSQKQDTVKFWFQFIMVDCFAYLSLYVATRYRNEPVLIHLQNGGFSARLTATKWHGVAIEECHEMQINKDAKLAVVRPSQQRTEYLSDYLPYRSACIKNLKQQLFPNNTESIPRLTIVQPVKINMLR